MKKLNFLPYLLLSMAFSVLLSMCRYHISGRVTYVFLCWNLILAFVPFAVSELMLKQ